MDYHDILIWYPLMNALMTKYGKYCTHVNTQLHVYFKHDVVGYQTVKLTKVIYILHHLKYL